ncbi:hypothetical protein BGZ89_002324 [Linnemannia elongata]|nr:hypothetical protein BGZ89_002324 [Linnemannia elongata]
MSSAAPVVAQSAFQKFLNHPAGPKTIHFWAPAAKWSDDREIKDFTGVTIRQTPPRQQDIIRSKQKKKIVGNWDTELQYLMPKLCLCALVGAGIGDLSRPAENLSLSQNVALAATGLIWSRYSLVIIPKNYSLFTVNLFVAATGLTQLYRIFDYRQGLKKAEEKKAVVAN